MRAWLFILLSMLSFGVVAVAHSPNYSSVTGKWLTFDKKTGKVNSVIFIRPRGRYVEGKIIKIFSVPDVGAIKYCQSCKGSRRNKPILGLTIIKDMHCKNGRCVDGNILDPRDGKVYHAKMQLIDRGRLLKVRGYVGIPLFGKTVVWKRLIPKRNVAY